MKYFAVNQTHWNVCILSTYFQEKSRSSPFFNYFIGFIFDLCWDLKNEIGTRDKKDIREKIRYELHKHHFNIHFK